MLYEARPTGVPTTRGRGPTRDSDVAGTRTHPGSDVTCKETVGGEGDPGFLRRDEWCLRSKGEN